MSDPRNDRTPSATRTGEIGCLPPGYQLHEFVIDAVLGEGGFGVVYSAFDTRLERRVAIKEYMPTSLATRDLDFSVHARSSADHQDAFVAGLRSFINEAKLLARFEHPSLVKVYQFWEERGTAYMVMPLYTAPTFKKWIKQRPKPVEEGWLVEFLDGVIDALDVLHKENCLHRDVAPDNILVLNDASPMLLDFGAARRVIGDMTHNLTVILKPGFAPVEQYAETSALKQGPWTDVYALSAVGYFAITGKAPLAAVGRMVGDELVPLRELAAGRYSNRLLSTLDAGLRVRPEERPLSMQALRAYLFGDAVPDDKTTIIAPKPAAPVPLSPAPGALHSTFKPKTSTPAPDDDATRVQTNAPARPVPAAAGGMRPPTVSPGAAPTVKVAPRPAAATPAETAQPQPRKRPSALIWAGSFAAGGAALVLGVAWWLDRSSPPAPPPQVEQKQASPPAPVVEVLPAPAPVPPPAPVAQAPAPVPAPVQIAPPPPPVQTAPVHPAPAPVQPPVKAAPPAIAAKPSPTPAPLPPAQRQADKKAQVAPPPVIKGDTPKVAEAPKPEPAGPRAPEGPAPLAVSDTGITALQIEGTVNPNDKEPLFAGYTCCNLHFDGDWVSDLNYSAQTRIPAGSPIKIVDYGRWRLMTEVGGKKIRIGLDYGRRQETLAQFARKLTVDKDLRFRMAALPPIVQDAIRAAKVLPGMSKEQVLMAVGFPARHETPSVNSADWKFWHTSRIQYTVHFDARGRVKDVEIDPEHRAKVVFGAK